MLKDRIIEKFARIHTPPVSQQYEGLQIMVVKGDSLEPANVFHDNIIYIDKLTCYEYSQLNLPKVCIFHRGEKYKEETNNKADYVVAQVFGRINVSEGNLETEIDNILKSSDFLRYKNDVRYVSDDYIKANFSFNNEYANISIYPHLNYDNKWILDYQDSTLIYGVAKYNLKRKK